MITEDAVNHVAKLARLALSEDEVHRYTQDLSKILHLVDELAELNLEADGKGLDVSQQTRFREDARVVTYDRDELMRNAPFEEDGFFRVPRILEEGE